MKRPLFASAVALSAIAAVVAVSPAFAGQDPKPKAVTWAEVGPILKKNCAGCHSGDYAKAGIHLDTKENLLKSKGAITPGKPDKSKVYLAVTGGKGVKKMPPGPKGLSTADGSVIKAWIEQGGK